MSVGSKKNQYEILFVPNNLVLVRTIRPICLEKAKQTCGYISKKTKRDAFWFYNMDIDEIEIYTENGNLNEARKALEEFEANYKSCLRKWKMIIKHRHKND